MTPIEKIEYYLGKDSHKNLYFKPEIPPAWEFPNYHWDLKGSASGTIIKENAGNFVLNKLGYRSFFEYDKETLQDHKCILCLGDSDTFGRGMLFENLWTTIIANEFPEYKVLNFGIPGAASDTVARIGVNTLRSLTSQVHAVLALWPAPHRREYASKSFTGLVYKLPLLAPTPTQDMLPFENYWEMIDWKANSYNFCKNQLLLSTSSNTNNSEYFDLQINTNDKQISDDFILGAAFGVNTQRAIANYFIKLLRKQPSYFDQTKMQV